jgi:hypothetical protein
VIGAGALELGVGLILALVVGLIGWLVRATARRVAAEKVRDDKLDRLLEVFEGVDATPFHQAQPGVLARMGDLEAGQRSLAVDVASVKQMFRDHLNDPVAHSRNGTRPVTG